LNDKLKIIQLGGVLGRRVRRVPPAVWKTHKREFLFIIFYFLKDFFNCICMFLCVMLHNMIVIHIPIFFFPGPAPIRSSSSSSSISSGKKFKFKFKSKSKSNIQLNFIVVKRVDLYST
jgi:hypothetical protein